ncbi:MAG: hypothetical protein EHM12_09585 [Dehalococcoidia bacterium]|nr:MAG: hypothetical protein EHM12_09585 [Dehalococcoidia bacterium]
MKTTPDSQLEFNLGEGEVETDVSIEAEAPEETSGAAQAAAPDQESQRSELDSVSDAVQKRISKLTARMRESERREQAALEYARGLQNQASHLQQRLVHTDYGRLNEAKARMEGQQSQLRAIIRKAREEGDFDTESEAQERLSSLVMDQRQVAGMLQSQQEQIKNYQEPVQQVAPQQAPQKAPPSPKAESWAARNPWFGQDRVMTYAAWGIHQTLVEQEGVDPNSDEYYTELDSRLRSELPKRFADETPQQNRQQRFAPAVAPASRSSGVSSVRRTVRLSPSQIAIAKKLNVPLEEYAKYVKE